MDEFTKCSDCGISQVKTADYAKGGCGETNVSFVFICRPCYGKTLASLEEFQDTPSDPGALEQTRTLIRMLVEAN